MIRVISLLVQACVVTVYFQQAMREPQLDPLTDCETLYGPTSRYNATSFAPLLQFACASTSLGSALLHRAQVQFWRVAPSLAPPFVVANWAAATRGVIRASLGAIGNRVISAVAYARSWADALPALDASPASVAVAFVVGVVVVSLAGIRLMHYKDRRNASRAAAELRLAGCPVATVCAAVAASSPSVYIRAERPRTRAGSATSPRSVERPAKEEGSVAAAAEERKAAAPQPTPQEAPLEEASVTASPAESPASTPLRAKPRPFIVSSVSDEVEEKVQKRMSAPVAAAAAMYPEADEVEQMRQPQPAPVPEAQPEAPRTESPKAEAAADDALADAEPLPKDALPKPEPPPQAPLSDSGLSVMANRNAEVLERVLEDSLALDKRFDDAREPGGEVPKHVIRDALPELNKLLRKMDDYMTATDNVVELINEEAESANKRRRGKLQAQATKLSQARATVYERYVSFERMIPKEDAEQPSAAVDEGPNETAGAISMRAHALLVMRASQDGRRRVAELQALQGSDEDLRIAPR
eukprot:m51a1_g3008 hypothetical protein (528) ;mRNA; r:831483-833509